VIMGTDLLCGSKKASEGSERKVPKVTVKSDFLHCCVPGVISRKREWEEIGRWYFTASGTTGWANCLPGFLRLRS